MTSSEMNSHQLPGMSPDLTGTEVGPIFVPPGVDKHSLPIRISRRAIVGPSTGESNAETTAAIRTNIIGAMDHTVAVSVPGDRQQADISSTGSPLPTPVNTDKLDDYLGGYDTDSKDLGFSVGFRIPFKGELSQNKHHTNLPSANAHSDFVTDKLQRELSLHRIAGPFNQPPFSNFVCSPIGVVPKKTLGDFRIIHHLSFPHG